MNRQYYDLDGRPITYVEWRQLHDAYNRMPYQLFAIPGRGAHMARAWGTVIWNGNAASAKANVTAWVRADDVLIEKTFLTVDEAIGWLRDQMERVLLPDVADGFHVTINHNGTYWNRFKPEQKPDPRFAVAA